MDRTFEQEKEKTIHKTDDSGNAAWHTKGFLKMDIKDIKELAKLFRTGDLSRDEGDVVVFDKSEATLMTEKEFYFEQSYEDIAWEALKALGIPAQGA